MKFGELVEQAIECIKTFNPVIKTIDSHAETFLSGVSCVLIIYQVKDPYEQVFIK